MSRKMKRGKSWGGELEVSGREGFSIIQPLLSSP